MSAQRVGKHGSQIIEKIPLTNRLCRFAIGRHIRTHADTVKKEEIPSRKRDMISHSERNDCFAFLHEQAGDDADNPDEEEVDPEEQDKDE